MNALVFVAVPFHLGVSACLSRGVIDKTYKKMCLEHEGIEQWQRHSCIQKKKGKYISNSHLLGAEKQHRQSVVPFSETRRV